MSCILELEQVSCRRGEQDRSFDVSIPSFTLASGELVIMSGPSGCGKSTVLEMLGLVLQPHRIGRFIWQSDSDGAVNIARLWERNDDRGLSSIRAREIGFVLQSGGLLPYLTVAENIMISRRISGLPCSGYVNEISEVLNIVPFMARKPHQLSIGERQRVSIARAMAHQPRLVLADEPTSALDPNAADAVFSLMMKLVAVTGCSAIIVTHDQQRMNLGSARIVTATITESGTEFSE